MTEVLFFSQILEFTLIYTEWIKQKQGSLHNAMPHCPNSQIVSFALLLVVVLLLAFFLHCTWCLFFVFPSLWLVKCPEAFSGVVLASTEATFVVCFWLSARLENPAMSCFASLKRKFNSVVSCLVLLVTFSRKITNELTLES